MKESMLCKPLCYSHITWVSTHEKENGKNVRAMKAVQSALDGSITSHFCVCLLKMHFGKLEHRIYTYSMFSFYFRKNSLLHQTAKKIMPEQHMNVCFIVNIHVEK